MRAISEKNKTQPTGPSLQPPAIRTNEVSTLSRTQGTLPDLIAALEALQTLVRFVCVGKRDCRISSEACCSLVTHRQDQKFRICVTRSLVPDYKDVVELLDSSFVPKVNVPCERHVFMQMGQQSLPSSVQTRQNNVADALCRLNH